MHQPNTSYELTNHQRTYFGLCLVERDWDKVQFDNVTLYFNNDQIVKILTYSHGYLEYDTAIATKNREILLPQTARGKEQKFSIPKILKVKGSGVQFSGSFYGGNMHVYNNKTNAFFIKSYPEEGDIKSYEDIDNWVSRYITAAPPDHFQWLEQQLSKKRLNIIAKGGDIIAFSISDTEFGFARVIRNITTEPPTHQPDLWWFRPQSLMIAVYAFYSKTIQVDIDKLINQKTLPAFCMFDLHVYRGEFPVIANRPLSEYDKNVTLSSKTDISITIPVTKQEIQAFINQ